MPDSIFWLKKTTGRVQLVVPKSISYAESRRNGRPPSDTKNRLKYSFQSVFNAVPALHFRDDKVSIAKIRLVPITVSQ